MPIKLLHIGVGARGRHWLEIVAHHPDFVSVACVDESESSLAEARRQPGQAHGHFFTNVEEALARTRADAALVSTPTFLHAQHTIQALDAGLPVLVEKPLADRLADAVRVAERSRAVSRPVMIAENYRFYQAERTLRHMIANEVAGRLHWAECVDRRCQPSQSQAPWVKGMDHPFLTEIAVHHFDSFRYLFGRRPAAIFALSYNLPESGYDKEVAVSAVIELDGGMPIQYGGTMAAARYEFSLWIEGEKGDLWTDRRRVWWRPRGSRFFRPSRSVQVPKGDELPYPKGGTVSLLNQFRDAVLHGHVPETSADDNLWTLAMVAASIRSHREGAKISISDVLEPALTHSGGPVGTPH
jgi:predicted dehydrogenase